MKKMVSRSAALGAVVVAMVGLGAGVAQAGAGRGTFGEVTISGSGSWYEARGVPRVARASGDPYQFISCSAASMGGTPHVECRATTATGLSRVCYSADPLHAQIVAGIDADSVITFQPWSSGLGHSTSSCHTIRVEHSSAMLDSPSSTTSSAGTSGGVIGLGMR